MFESRRRAVIFTSLSILMALTATILFSNYIKSTKQSMGELAQVLVAKTDIVAGRPIDPDSFTTEEVPRKYLLPSVIQTKEELKNKITVVPIPKGQVITTSVLRDNTVVSGDLRQVILRAPMAVFDDSIDVFDKVDIIVSYDDQSGSPDSIAKQQGVTNAGSAQGQDRRVTKVLLKDVTVNNVQKKNETELSAIGVVLSLENSKSAVWALNYAKEVRVLKSGTSKALKEGEKKP
ncbi:SAF domain-containing protein [Paenibacillus aurantius]|uniref:SAF domain-containing protein n=1 Tax=Paenibacillus aurantius TaxID=2918900 RepID=A0AA96LB27_9BACL|nr:SAF domain-containing protein [Paenibacillus aurantius]WNQ09863.1 SAF domain-containing protein [Paenibacillus aurantius]